jgi:hypothetical protein
VLVNRVTLASAAAATLGAVTHPLAKIASTAALLVLLNGCAGLTFHDRADGWRSAVVMDLGRAGELAPKADHDCAFGAAPNAPYLVVRYRDHGVQTWSLGTSDVPPNADFRAGEAVEINIKDCEVRRPS